MDIDQDDKQILYVDSTDRLSGSFSSSKFTIKLDIDTSHEFDSVVCLSVSIPKSFYMVRAGYNVFTLVEGGVSASVIIAIGNCNINSFMLELTNKLTAASISIGNNSGFTLTYPNINTSVDTGKITFTTTYVGTTEFIFPSAEGINIQMGFNANSTETFVGGVLTSRNVVNLQTDSTLYLVCDCVNDGSSNILQEIYSQDWATMGVIRFQTTETDAWSKPLLRKNDQLYSFQLINSDEQLVDLNGLNWQCRLMFYKRNKLWSKLKKFVDYLLTII